MKAKNLVGVVFGRLTVIAPTDQRAKGSGAMIWNCHCSCGMDVLAQASNLIRGITTSCGCVDRRRTHGANDTREYQAWENMRQRCGNARHPQYKNYGARGISVCDRWEAFEEFIADMGRCPEGLTLERIDGNKGYEPTNCKWATYSQQNRNTRRNHWVTIDGVTLCVQDWCARTGVTLNAVNGRLRKGWTFQRIFTTPLLKRGYRHHSTS